MCLNVGFTFRTPSVLTIRAGLMLVLRDLLPWEYHLEPGHYPLDCLKGYEMFLFNCLIYSLIFHNHAEASKVSLGADLPSSPLLLSLY